jgi:hypothetical protein
MLRKDTKWEWTTDRLQAFEELKKSLTSPPVLIPPNPLEKFHLFCDASNLAVGAVLQQLENDHFRPCGYVSYSFSKAELNWDTREKEIFAIKFALEKWKHLLLGVSFELYTDHQSIKYFRTTPFFKPKLHRWFEFINQFDFNIHHIPGSSNIVADALSRQSTNENLTFECNTISTEDSPTKWKQAYLEDPAWTTIFNELESLPNHSKGEFKLLQGYIMNSRGRIEIPRTLLFDLLDLYHSKGISGHLGIRKSYAYISRKFHYPKLEHEMEQFIRKCDICQRVKDSTSKPLEHPNPLEIEDQPWQSIAMDWVTDLPRSKSGKDAILTVTDRFSKMVHLIPTSKTENVEKTAKLFFEHVVKHHGLPREIVSDRDTKFTSKFWRELCNSFEIKQAMSTAFHPRTDGQSERTNRTFAQILRAICSEHNAKWEVALPLVEMAINNSTSNTTGHSPFYLNHGFEMVTPFELHLPKGNSSPWGKMLESLRQTWELTHEKLKARRDIILTAEHKPLPFRVGDKVLLSTRNMPRTTSKKMTQRWIGPFEIIKEVGGGSFKLELPTTMGIHPVFHSSLLKPYHSN